MSDNKIQKESSPSSSSTSSSNNHNSDAGNEIPYVPPTDRTNLSENLDFDRKPFIPPNITTKREE